MPSNTRKQFVEATKTSRALSISPLLTDDIMGLRIKTVRIQVSSSSKQPSAGLAGSILSAIMGQGRPVQPAAHFRLFFQLEDLPGSANIRSIEINSTLEGAHPALVKNKKTILKTIYRDYPFSSGAAISRGRMIDFVSEPIPIQSSAHSQASVRGLIDLLLQRGRHLYQLHASSGSGCRYFCATVLRDCYDAGWLSMGFLDIVEDITKTLKSNRTWEHVDLPIPAPQGTFYDIMDQQLMLEQPLTRNVN